MHYQNTLVGLAQRAKHHERQVALIRMAEEALRKGEDIVFQVHLQANAPGETSIMAQDADLQMCLQNARRLWDAYNSTSVRYTPPRPEVFVVSGSVKVAIDPFDLGSESMFFLDPRIANFPRQMAFDAAETKMPSPWYATIPTPEPSPAKSARTAESTMTISAR